MQLRHRYHNFALPTMHLEFNKRHFVARVYFDYVCLMCVTCLFYKIILDLFLIHFLISITLYLCVSFVMSLLWKHVRLTCGFNKLMMMMITCRRNPRTYWCKNVFYVFFIQGTLFTFFNVFLNFANVFFIFIIKELI